MVRFGYFDTLSGEGAEQAMRETVEGSATKSQTGHARVAGKCGYLPLALPILLAVLTTFLAIGRESLWLDEGHSVTFAGAGWSGMWGYILHGETNMGLYYVLLHFWMKCGDSEAWLRSLSAIFAVLTVPVVFAIARRIAGTRAAFAAALLLATNLFFIQSAQEVRGYTLALLLSATSTLWYLRVVEQPSRRNWVGYVVVSVLAVHAHVFCALVLLGHGVSTMMLPGRWGLRRSLLLAGLLMAVLLIPFALALVAGESGNIDWLEKPELGRLGGLFVHLAGCPPLLPAHVAAIVMLLLGPVILPGKIGRDRMPRAWKSALLVCWLVVPILVAFLLSQFKPMFEDRYFFICLPAMVILTGVAVSLIRNRAVFAIVVLLLVGLSAPTASTWYRNLFRENWRGATRLILEGASDRDLVGFYSYRIEPPYDYYVSRSDPALEVPQKVRLTSGPILRGAHASPPDLDLIDDLWRRGERFWLALSHCEFPGKVDSNYRPIVERLGDRYTLVRQTRFRGVVVQLYDLETRDEGSD